jgi:signal transduction histidine kinase
MARNKAEESDKLKSSFINNMSHEIRTPINAIVGFADLLDEPDYSEEEKTRFRGLIRASSQHLLSVITDILQISTIDTGQVLLNRKTFGILPELQSIFDSFQPLVAGRQIRFALENQGVSDDLTLTTDRTKWIQVLNNLLTNALKFTSKGEIILGCRHLPDFIEFYVSDTGIGLDPGKQDLIFEKFRQADHSITRKYGGSGLGLAISKAYVELMGGTIRVDSRPGEGSRFSFTVPTAAI